MKKLVFLGAVMLLAVSCSKDKVPVDVDLSGACTDTISFSGKIQPMMDTYCVSCHGTGNSTGYTLTNHANISSNASAVLNAMTASGGMQLMPQGGPALADSLIQQFNCWINQGKLNN